MDKAYTIMYSVDKRGLISGNPFTNYSTSESILSSLDLPSARYNWISGVTDVDIQIEENKFFDIKNILLEKDLEGNFIVDEDGKYKIRTDTANIIVELNNLVSEGQTIVKNSTDTALDDIVDKYNNYIYNSTGTLRNKVFRGIYIQASDLKNMEAAERPMDAGFVKDTISEVYKEEGKSEEPYMSEYNPVTIYTYQKRNSVGKVDVGIFANGIKAAGAIQTYYNQELKKSEIYPENLDFSLDLSISSSAKSQNRGKLIINQKIVRYNNTKLTHEQWEHIASKYGNILPDEYVDSLLRVNGNKVAEFTNFYKQMKSNLKLFHDIYGENNNLADFLEFSSQFEEQIDDLVSILISLATDNAKELQLEKINADPDLASFPVAMLILGIDCKSVLTVCVDHLGVILKELQKNRFGTGNTKVSVDEIIGKLKKEGIFDEKTANSLRTISKVAQELRYITSFFKVNQGVDTRYADLQTFISRLSKCPEVLKKPENLTDFIKFIDFYKMFTDKEYQNQLIKQFNENKISLNIVDLILKSPHFREQLRSVAETVNIVQGVFGKTKIMEELITKVELPKSQAKESMLRGKFNRLIDHYILQRFLSDPNLTFRISDINRVYPNNPLERKGFNEFLTLNTPNGVDSFLEFIDYKFIPDLQQKYPGNFFLESLIKKSRRSAPREFFDLKYDPYDVEDPTTANNLNIARREFETIKDNYTGFTTANGKQLKVGEVFYLYSLITSQSYTTGLKTITTSSVETSNILKPINEEYKELDIVCQGVTELENAIHALKNQEVEEELLEKLRSGNFNRNEYEILNLKNIETLLQNYRYYKSIINFLTPYAKALSSRDMSTSYFVNAGDNKQVSMKLSLKDQFIITQNLPAPDRVVNTDVFKNYIQNQFPLTSVNVINNDANCVFVVNVKNFSGQIISSKSFAAMKTTNGEIASNEMTKISSEVIKWISGIINSNSSIQGYDIQDQSIANKLDIQLEKDHPLYEFLHNNVKIASIRDGQSCVRYINDEPIFMINELDFIKNKKGQLPKSSINKLVDLQVTSVAKSFLIFNKIKTALELYVPDIEINEYNYVEVINQRIEDIKTTPAYGYIKNLLTLEREGQIKRQIQIKLALYERALSNVEAYYNFDQENFKEDPLKEGDLCINKNGQAVYIYLGHNSGQEIYVKVSDDGDVISYVNLKLAEPGETKFKKIGSLVLNNSYIIGSINGDTFQYGPPDTSSLSNAISSAKIGSKIQKNNNSFVVTDILYFNNTRRVILKDIKSEKIYIFNEVNGEITPDRLFPYSLDTNSTIYTPTGVIAQINNTISTRVGNDKLPEHIIYDLLKKAPYSSSIIVKVGNEQETKAFGYVLNSEYVITAEGEKISIADIISIPINEYQLDPELAKMYAPKIVVLNNKGKNEAQVLQHWLPEFTDGYESTINKVNDVRSTIITSNRKFFIPSNYKLTTIPNIGDIVVISNNEGKIGRIKEKIGDKYLVLAFDGEKYNYCMQKNPIAYSTSPSYSIPNEVSTDVAAANLLKHIQDMTGLPIKIIDDKNLSHFAKVTSNEIEINIANKGDMDISEYILSQSVHEFIHIALASLRANNPTVYWNLLKNVALTNDTELNEEIYKDEFSKKEEQLVRKITEKYMESIKDEAYSFDEIIAIINNELKNIISTSEIGNIDETVQITMSRYGSNLIRDNKNDLNVTSIKDRALKNSILSNIKVECKQ